MGQTHTFQAIYRSRSYDKESTQKTVQSLIDIDQVRPVEIIKYYVEKQPSASCYNKIVKTSNLLIPSQNNIISLGSVRYLKNEYITYYKVKGPTKRWWSYAEPLTLREPYRCFDRTICGITDAFEPGMAT